MNKVHKSFACPKCGAHGDDIKISPKEKYEKYANQGVTGFDIKKNTSVFVKNVWNHMKLNMEKLNLENMIHQKMKHVMKM